MEKQTIEITRDEARDIAVFMAEGIRKFERHLKRGEYRPHHKAKLDASVKRLWDLKDRFASMQ